MLTLDGLLSEMRRMRDLIDYSASPSFGVPIIVSPHLPLDHVGHEIEAIPLTRQPRSKRLWKKLRQRRQRRARPIMQDTAIVIGGRMFVSPRMAREMAECNTFGRPMPPR
jgi:hypothetical protein